MSSLGIFEGVISTGDKVWTASDSTSTTQAAVDSAKAAVAVVNLELIRK